MHREREISNDCAMDSYGEGKGRITHPNAVYSFWLKVAC